MYLHTYMHICKCVCMCVCECMCVCVCVYSAMGQADDEAINRRVVPSYSKVYLGTNV
jgi:hypothetical protein